MFHYDRGLKLTRADLAVDFRRRQPRAFVSHAHSDHMARHQLAICTPATGKLYRCRLGDKHQVLELPYGQSLEYTGLRLTTFPAGHCLGSAMLLAEDESGSLLYTGDFKLSESLTAERAALPRARILVMESTFGDPRYRFPERRLVVEQLCQTVADILAAGAVPAIHAYSLGKAQEVTAILAAAGFAVLQHADAFEVSAAYEACGVSLGKYGRISGAPPAGHAVVLPPNARLRATAGGRRVVTISVSGWALVPETRRWCQTDHAIPLSDHADFDELLETIERVDPEWIFCTHGPVQFVDHLRRAGLQAHSLAAAAEVWPPRQHTFDFATR